MSENNPVENPVVVDSPVPSTPLDATPSQFEDKGTPLGAGGDKTDVKQSETTKETEAVGPSSDAWKKELSETFQFSADKYTTKEDALQAARDYAEQLAIHGRNSAVNFGTPVLPEDDDEILTDIELPDDDDDVSPVLRKLVEAHKKMATELSTRKKQDRESQTQQTNELKQKLAARAVAAVDSIASEHYGVGDTRNAAQALRARGLLELTEQIAVGFVAAGRKPPPIETIVRLAANLDSGANTPKSEGLQAATPPPGGPNQAPIPDSQVSTGQKTEENQGNQEKNSPWSRRGVSIFTGDPKFRNAVKSILSK